LSCYFIEATAFAKLFVREPGTDALIRLMEAVEDNRKLISASTPLEVYAAVRRRQRGGDGSDFRGFSVLCLSIVRIVDCLAQSLLRHAMIVSKRCGRLR